MKRVQLRFLSLKRTIVLMRMRTLVIAAEEPQPKHQEGVSME